MAFVKIEDLGGETEVILFPSSYQTTRHLWTQDRVVVIRGKLSAKNRDGKVGDEVKLLVDEAREISLEQAHGYRSAAKESAAQPILSGPGAKATAALTRRVYLKLESSEDQELLKSLKQTIDAHAGSTEVVLVLGEEPKRQAIKLPSGIDLAGEGPDMLRSLVGQGNVAVR